MVELRVDGVIDVWELMVGWVMCGCPEKILGPYGAHSQWTCPLVAFPKGRKKSKCDLLPQHIEQLVKLQPKITASVGKSCGCLRAILLLT